MWVMLNDSFLSIVAHRSKRNVLLVRARRADDITLIFPNARIIEGAGTDYEYRALIKRRVVEQALVEEVRRIDYHNFKDSVREPLRHDVYMDVWIKLLRLSRRWRQRVPIEPVEPPLDPIEFPLTQDG